MHPQRILFTGSGALRAPWRVLAFYVAFAILLIPSAFLLSFLPGGGHDGGPPRVGVESLESLGTLVAVLGATWYALWRFGRRSWGEIWLGRDALRLRVLALGVLLGVLPIALPTLVLVAVGWLRFAPQPDGSSLEAALVALAVLLPAAFFEELFSRGYALLALKEAIGWWPAILATSLLFGVLHSWNPGATALSVSLVTLAGVLLGAVVMGTGSLWAATLAHFFWNWTMAALLHAPVSGLGVATPDYRLLDAGPDWLTGGAWGPEGGAGAAVGMLAGIGYLYARWRRRREET